MAKPDIISQSQASKLAGVSRQALSEMFRKDNSQYNFFTPDGKVDSSHKDWKQYLSDRSDKGARSGNKNPVKENKPHGQDKLKSEKQKNKQTRDEPDNKKWSAEHALTGGYDPAMFYPSGPAQLKSLTDIVAKNLEMRIKLGELIPRDMLDNYMDSISQCMQLFVEVGRMVSGTICNKLDRKGMEKEVEKIINPEIKKIIEQTIKICGSAKNRK